MVTHVSSCVRDVHTIPAFDQGIPSSDRPATCSSGTSQPPDPNERRVADITEFSTGEGKLFLAGVRDLFG